MQPVASTDGLFSGNITNRRHFSDISRKFRKMRVLRRQQVIRRVNQILSCFWSRDFQLTCRIDWR